MPDMRSEELIVPYVHEPQAKKGSGGLGSTLPVAAMFMRSKILGWCAFFTALQTYLSEPHYAVEEDSTPSWLPLVTAAVGVGVTYMDFVMGRPAANLAKAAADAAAETAATLVETATAAA